MRGRSRCRRYRRLPCSSSCAGSRWTRHRRRWRSISFPQELLLPLETATLVILRRTQQGLPAAWPLVTVFPRSVGPSCLPRIPVHSTFVAGVTGGEVCELGGPQRCEGSGGFGGEHARCRAHVIPTVVEHRDAFDDDSVRQVGDQGHTGLGDGGGEASELV